MRKIIAVTIILILSLLPALSANLKAYDYANDFADVLTSETENHINQTGRAFQKTNGTQIVVVTTESLEGESVEDFAYDLFNDWGIGDKNEDNGILILLSVGDREVRIEVGDGMEGIFNDAKVGRMLDTLAVPHFAENDFDTGMKNLFDGVVQVVGNPELFESEEDDAGEIAWTIAIILVLLILSIFTGGRGGSRGWRHRGSWFGGYGGTGGFGGPASGGGFGGFGGGGSSGGGASRRF